MLTKKLSFTDFDGFGGEVERTVTVRFLYTLKAIKLYELRTGRNFFDDNQKAVNAYTDALREIGIERASTLTNEEQLQLLPLLLKSDYLQFLMDAIPCLYGEVQDGKFIQNDLTAENAEFSLWIGELLTIQFYTELILELTRSKAKVPQDKKKPKQKKSHPKKSHG